MKLFCHQYTSPIPTYGTFESVYIEESCVKIEKFKKSMSINFEMYYFKDGERIVIDERRITFYGMNGDSVTSKDAAIISIPNIHYQEQVDAVPLTIEVPNTDYQPQFILVNNPDYNPEEEGSEEFIMEDNPEYNESIPYFITIDNPDYESQINSVSTTVSIALMDYLYQNAGVMPEVYEVVKYGFPNFQTASSFFNGGEKNDTDISVLNPFAKEWVKNMLIMQNEPVGNQFNFVNE